VVACGSSVAVSSVAVSSSAPVSTSSRALAWSWQAPGETSAPSSATRSPTLVRKPLKRSSSAVVRSHAIALRSLCDTITKRNSATSLIST
jgi:hypothetical protein